jgi:branched-chain amino acid aminotransferase
MDLIVYLNGNFVKAHEAKVSVYDHSFLYGDGVFETMRAYKRCVFKFEDHVQRLYGSLKQIYMDMPIAPNMMLKAIKLLLQYNQLSDAYIRIMVSRGEGPIGLDVSLCPNPTLFIVAEQPHNYPTNWYLQGVSTIIVSHRHIPDVCLSTSIKSCNYLVNILARKEAQDKGAQEAIMLNMEGYITEGTVSNIFLFKDKKIFTPALSSGILDGITRKTVIELAEQRGVEVVERHVSPEEIFSAQECFITNTTMEILPVTFCDGAQIADGKPGKFTKVLMKDYKRIVEDAIESEKD